MYDAGEITLCTLTDTADPGDMPKYQLSPVITQYYEERYLSYTRQYAAKGVNEQIDLQIRIWDEGTRPTIGMYAVISGEQFRIINTTPAMDDDNLRVYDLSLSRMEENYDVPGTDQTGA